MPTRRALPLALLLAAACGGCDGRAPLRAHTDAGAATTMEGSVPPESECLGADYGGDPPRAGSCATAVSACLPGQGNGCSLSAFALTLNQAIAGCGQYCGDLGIGFDSGCLTIVGGYLGTLEGTTP